jgi:hypothetical protein
MCSKLFQVQIKPTVLRDMDSDLAMNPVRTETVDRWRIDDLEVAGACKAPRENGCTSRSGVVFVVHLVSLDSVEEA